MGTKIDIKILDPRITIKIESPDSLSSDERNMVLFMLDQATKAVNRGDEVMKIKQTKVWNGRKRLTPDANR